MGNVQQKGRDDGLTRFQTEKLTFEFDTFFDLNKDGYLTYKDLLWAKDKICYMSGWKIDSPKYKITEVLFNEIWDSLTLIADLDKDGKITKDEWLLMWTAYKKEIIAREKEEKDYLKKFYKSSRRIHMVKSSDVLDENRAKEVLDYDQDEDWPVQLESDEEPLSIMEKQTTKKKATPSRGTSEEAESFDGEENEENVAKPAKKSVLEQFAADKANFEESKLPKWLYKYLVFRFNLLDRTGDNVIDHEEFEYVLSGFGVKEKIARQAFTIFTQNQTIDLDFDYFVQLFEEYYLSDDPSDLGTFINGRLDFPVGGDEREEGEENEKTCQIDVQGSKVDQENSRPNSAASFRSMDDDINPFSVEGKKDEKPSTKKSSVIKLPETLVAKCFGKAPRDCCNIL